MTRQSHDTAFGIASELTRLMECKLHEAEQQSFHKLVYAVAKSAIERHDALHEREAERVRGNGRG
jgi:hypothetical protein